MNLHWSRSVRAAVAALLLTPGVLHGQECHRVPSGVTSGFFGLASEVGESFGAEAGTVIAPVSLSIGYLRDYEQPGTSKLATGSVAYRLHGGQIQICPTAGFEYFSSDFSIERRIPVGLGLATRVPVGSGQQVILAPFILPALVYIHGRPSFRVTPTGELVSTTDRDDLDGRLDFGASIAGSVLYATISFRVQARFGEFDSGVSLERGLFLTAGMTF